MDFERRCWAEIELSALRHNFSLTKRAAGDTPIMAVVKADAYGHGDTMCAKLFSEEGAAAFAVSGFEEALRLRASGLEKPILILGYTGPKNVRTLVEENIWQTAYSFEYAAALSYAATRAGVTLPVHIKIDTGMGRLGFPVRDELESAVENIANVCHMPGISAQGVFTHFAAADSKNPDDIAYTHAQYALFQQALQMLKQQYGVSFACVHTCNSAATFAYPEYHCNYVRPGICLFGENPSGDVALTDAQHALQLKAKVTMVKDIPAGDAISYGRTFVSNKPMRIATLSVGYADGYPREMSNCGIIEVCGKPARVVGLVCMDQIMADVTGIEGVKQGQVATIFGGPVADSVEKIAAACNTINYEILCDIGRRVQRVYTDEGKLVELVNYLRNV